MSHPETFGLGNDCYLLNEELVDDTTARASEPKRMTGARRVSLQLITEGSTRTFETEATDAVVAATSTWTFANGGFTDSDVGGTFTVPSGTNAGTYEIDSVTDPETVVSVESPVGNETFSAGVVITVVRTSTLAGAWHVYLSNDYAPGGAATDGQVPTDGHWTEVSALFSDTQGARFFPALDAAAGSPTSQIVHMDVAARAFKVSFVPSSGEGNIAAIHSGGSY